MNTVLVYGQTIARRAMLAGVLLWATGVAAQTALPPNLKPMPASNFSLVTQADGTLDLRFATTSWNNGTGPYSLRRGASIPGKIPRSSRCISGSLIMTGHRRPSWQAGLSGMSSITISTLTGTQTMCCSR